MARRENPKSEQEKALNAAQGAFSANPQFILPQIQHLLMAQQRILEEMETFSSEWMERRQEATRTMIDTGRRILAESPQDPAAALREIAEWQTHSMERLAEDAKACTEMMSICAGAIVSNEVEALEETAETAKQATKSSKSTPV